MPLIVDASNEPTFHHSERGGRTYIRVPLAVRFWSHVDKNGTVPKHRPELGSCWIWTGSKSRKGYGGIRESEGRRLLRAHRVSWAIHHGPVNDEDCVLHHCDNPACVRPDHLWIGTYKDNAVDAARKGRSPLMQHPESARRGERHHMAVLTDSQVAELRALHVAGHAKRSLARKFGVSRGCVCGILRGTRRRATVGSTP